jgi:hypothetical protein
VPSGEETVILQKKLHRPLSFCKSACPCCSPRSPSDTTTQSGTSGGRASGREHVVGGDCRPVTGRISGNGCDDHIPSDGRNAGGERGSGAGRDSSGGGSSLVIILHYQGHYCWCLCPWPPILHPQYCSLKLQLSSSEIVVMSPLTSLLL